jgi:hypothetical protein
MFDRITLTDSAAGTSQTFALTPISPPSPPAKLELHLKPDAVWIPAALADNTTVYFQRGGKYSINSALIKAKNVTFCAEGSGPDPLLFSLGNGKGTYMLTLQGSGCIIDGLVFHSELADKGQRASAIEIQADDCLISNCTFGNVDTAVQCAGKHKNLRVIGCTDNDDDTAVAAYCLWFEGLNGQFLKNKFRNSIDQHIVRATNGADGLTIADNELSNLDRRGLPGGDPGDYAKGCITLQNCRNVLVINNRCSTGGVRVGPLGNVGEDGKPWANEPITERCQNITIQGNTFTNLSFIIDHGSQDVIVAGNVFELTDPVGGPAIAIAGYNQLFQRGVERAAITGNIARCAGENANFLRSGGPVKNIVVRNNTFAAPKLKVGDAGSAPVYVNEPDLGNWTFEGNRWQIPAAFGWYARNLHPAGQEGINHVGTTEDEPTWKNPAAWAAYPQVKGDSFQ